MLNIEQLGKDYDECLKRINGVYEVFKDYFGEERVDLQNVASKTHYINNYTTLNSVTIIVHFPEVTVTNEYNSSVNITDLWAKIKVSYSGTIRGTFTLNRSSYTKKQWVSDYMHSHIPGIPKTDVSKFLEPCLGTGPIRATIASLATEYDTSLWYLFCRELDVYTKTESIAGVPYRRMSNIGINSTLSPSIIPESSCYINYRIYSNNSNRSMVDDILEPFISSVVNSKVLKFNFKNNRYDLAMDWFDYIINISNIFISWYNTQYEKGIYTYTYRQLLEGDIIIPVNIKNRQIYSIKNTYNGSCITMYNNLPVLNFKNKDILLQIEDDMTETEQANHILNNNLSMAILRALLSIININYGRETAESINTNDTHTRIIV